MKKLPPTYLIVALSLMLSYATNAQQYEPLPTFVNPVYEELPLGSIKPSGWLRNQLKIMSQGSTGHLDEVYKKVANDNGWLGGEGDGWEETPYWLDGAVPLAYLLEDSALQQKAQRYIDWTLDHQRPSGYFGPITEAEREHGITISPENCEDGQDWWPKMIMLKVLKQYYEATNDERVIDFMTNYFTYQRASLEKCPISTWTEWAESRGAENVMIIQWLYRITQDTTLLKLAELIDQQSYPWSEWLGSRDWVINAAAYQNKENWMSRHAVNVAMALKSPAINYQRTHNEQYLRDLKTGFSDLMTLHGLPMGIFSGDEDLHGNDPIQGIELCAIVESMFSLEKIIAVTGDSFYMDALERMAFNALPAQTTDDYNAKQYYQMANQVQVSRGVFNFSLPFSHEMNNVFGMRSGYTCCLANMHQGWTKFTSHLWYATPDKGLAALHYAPCQVTTLVGKNNITVTIQEETNYPFEDEIRFTLTASEPVNFSWKFRIPQWCDDATISVNGEAVNQSAIESMIILERTWNDQDKVVLKLPMQPSLSNWGRNSRAVERGPLVYALKLNERWETGYHEEEGEYFSVFPMDDWNYGLPIDVLKYPAENLEVKQSKIVTDDFVWNLAHTPIEITAPAKRIPNWKLVDGVAHTPVSDRFNVYRGEVDNQNEQITLVPFGCTKVRIVAFPIVP